MPKVQEDPELKDDSMQGFTKDTMNSQIKRSRRHSGRRANAPLQVRETSSEHTARKTRRRSRKHSYETVGSLSFLLFHAPVHICFQENDAL